MKHLLFFVFSFSFAANIFSQHVDTTTTYQFNDNVWEPSQRTVYSFNSSCLVDSTIQQDWDTHAHAWQNIGLVITTYTVTGKESQEIGQSWTSGWKNVFRYTYMYNTNDQISVFLAENWDATSGSWVGSYRTTSSYNANGLFDSSLSESNSSGSWQNSSLFIWHYNANNLEDTDILQTWNTTSWENSSRYLSAYNADNTLNNLIGQKWDQAFSEWSNQTRRAFTYTASKQRLTDTSQRWNITQWNSTELTIETYSGSDLITSLSQTSNDNGSTWVNYSRVNFTHNGDGTVAETIHQNWDGSNWINVAKITFHYSATCTLPVTLLNFTAALNGKAAQLQWVTSTEINTKNFIVQRSIDGVHFQNIGSVNAVGNSTRKTLYLFNDGGAINAGSNKLYYRLQMVDKDGRFAFSKIAVIEIVNDKLFAIYPNPVRDVLLVKTNLSLNNIDIRITNQNGKVIISQHIVNVQAGEISKINVSVLNSGVYYLQLITGGKVQTAKLFKY